MIAKLRNPFQWESPAEKGRLFGHYRARMRAKQAMMKAAPVAVAPDAAIAPVPAAPGAAPGAAPQPGMAPPGPGGETAPGVPAPTTGAEAFAAAAGAGGPGFGGGAAGGSLGFNMIGDLLPPTSLVRAAAGPPPPPPPGARSFLAPSVRGFKIADNQSPVPQDRVYFTFNYFNNVNQRLDNFFNTNFTGVQIYRYIWGFEKTFNDGGGSFGMTLPLNSIFARSREPNLNGGGSGTALGDLTVYLKHVFAVDPKSGSLATGGLAVTPRTAGRVFGGAPFLSGSNTTSIQPFFAYLYNFGDFYLHGFESIDTPFDSNQPTMIYNDVGLGYYLYRSNDWRRLISAVVPTVELHANIPLNHRGAYDALDRFGTPDVVDITGGINVRLGERTVATFGMAVPVTGPRAFNYEVQALLNIFFGRMRRPPAPPMVGG
jgi:hypothetical protein